MPRLISMRAAAAVWRQPGSGDVLTGVIAGLIAQGLRPEDAASLGVYLHGLAGEESARTEANLCMQAGDIIKGIKTIYQKEGR